MAFAVRALSPSLLLLVFLTLGVTGCRSVHGSATPLGSQRYAPHQGPVRLSALRPLPGAELVGEVAAHGVGSVQEVVPEFVARVQELGGDHGVIERWAVRFVWQSRPYTQSFNCGSPRFPTMCSRTYFIQEEVGELHLEGRAYRSRGPR